MREISLQAVDTVMRVAERLLPIANGRALTAAETDLVAFSDQLTAAGWRWDGERASPPADANPKTPPPGLLMSMALRYDHGLGMPGFYDQALTGGKPGTHAARLKSTLGTMQQLWEEVSGNGFYSPEREAGYVEMRDGALVVPETGEADKQDVPHPLELIARLVKVVERLPAYERMDHACAECRPQSHLLVPGFRCAYHQAKGLLERTGYTEPRAA